MQPQNRSGLERMGIDLDTLIPNGDIPIENITPFNISNADFHSIKIIKKCKINRRAFPFGLFL